LEAVAALRGRQEIDQTLKNLKLQIQKEKESYLGVGLSLLGKFENEEIYNDLYAIIHKNQERYTYKEGKLTAHFDPKQEEAVAAEGQKLIALLSQVISTKQGSEAESYVKIKNRVISGLQEAVRARKKQQNLFDQYKGQVQQ